MNTLMTGRRRAPEAIVEGAPTLALRDEDREAVADAIADLILDAFSESRHGDDSS